jgi:hypothetical protein
MTRLFFTDYDYADDERDDLRREAAWERRASRRLAELRSMHPGDPDFDPDELEGLEEALCE